MKHVKEIDIREIELDELDFVWQDKLMGPSSDGHDYKIISNHSYWQEGDPVLIETLIKELTNLSKSGATYVRMYNNCDHHSYILSGMTLELLSEEEVAQEDVKEAKLLLKEYEGQLESLEKVANEKREWIKKIKKELG